MHYNENILEFHWPFVISSFHCSGINSWFSEFFSNECILFVKDFKIVSVILTGMGTRKCIQFKDTQDGGKLYALKAINLKNVVFEVSILTHVHLMSCEKLQKNI